MNVGAVLEATGVSKHYGAVAALQDASLRVESGQVIALMGANGAGKSTLVKIMSGAITATQGTLLVRGKALRLRSPASARQAGLVPVYQESSLIPDLDIHDNLRLCATPVEPFRHWVNELGIASLDMRRAASRLPLAVQRILDLARALASEPSVLLLDEMTAALPSNLVDKVLDVIMQQLSEKGTVEGYRTLVAADILQHQSVFVDTNISHFRPAVRCRDGATAIADIPSR